MGPANVTKFTPRANQPVDAFAEQLVGTLDIMPLAFAIFMQDQREDGRDRALQFYPIPGAKVITPEQRGAVLDRAFTVMALGDPAKRAMMDDMAAMTILRGVLRGISAGTIEKDSPLANLDLSTAKVLAQFAVHGALAFAAGHPLGPHNLPLPSDAR